jgi:hypothetical protein
MYDLYTSYVENGTQRTFSSRTAVSVTREDVTGLSLTVSSGALLEAEVVFKGTSPQPFKMDALRLDPQAVDSTPTRLQSNPLGFDSNGRLKAEGIPEGTYRVSLTGLPDTAYVGDVTQGGKSVYDEGFVVGSTPNPVQIIINLNGGAVSGAVHGGGGFPLNAATVVLVPAEARRRNPNLFKTARPDEQGRFTIRGIEPGTYTLFAWGDRPFREPWLNPAFLERYQGRGRTVRIPAGNAEPVELELIQKER